ncbi:peptidase [Embleya scabrispora]|uniref:Peptidase n=1 Tax=Embleya scabrispora TaxID=159449 RepID=A0A1T3P4V0_9ACTN|nr:terpene cyclase/mutase family protein [Embleya scabrispora]OPC84106.1 peptidase [Embleya scabrispora]
MTLTRPGRRIAALFGGLALAGTAAMIPSTAAAAPPTTDTTPQANVSILSGNRTQAAAGWLARQLVDGERFETTFDGVTYPDQGLTIDAIFAFAAAGVADDNGAKATTWLARPEILSGYIGDGTTNAYAGATAKTLLAAEVRGVDPTSFGGVDLPTRLRSLQQPSGRFTDTSPWGDYSNAFSQSLALLALDRTPAGAPAAAVDFLADAHCADGGFPLNYGLSTCTSDADSTAISVQALAATGRHQEAAAGLNWLASHRLSDGGFGTVGATTSNANSTGLAAQALLSSWRVIPGLTARHFLTERQVGCSASTATRGAIAYDTGGYNPATATRATAQAVLGLAGTGFADLSSAGARRNAPELHCPTTP